ncbi:MAG: 3-deoxy-manno-octulosonate cytidylyltransferase, partial [Silvanigrellaceae bacterium]|nr:3-deoxy-manno-octulosonate cytidylyltransferase [Silvanigrellaceae bacterium]
MRKIIVGIPARMGATRLPGKPLKKILNKTVIEHVFLRSKMAKLPTDVFVATCDPEIKEVVENAGGTALMTRKEIQRPALRVAEAMSQLSLDENDIIVIVQGDEPLIHPEMIDRAINEFMKNSEDLCACLMAHCSEEEWKDPNEIKVVTNLRGYATYMSRSPIPYISHTKDSIGPRYKQVCVFPFTVKSLKMFLNLSETPCELSESIELLRGIEHGLNIKMVKTNFVTKSIDTEEDRQRITKMME